MDTQRLSHLVDSIIADILSQRMAQFASGEKVVRVIISGADLTALPATLDCLAALDRHGYLLVMTFSYSASQSVLQSACLNGLQQRGIEVLCDSREPQPTEREYSSFYFPALSSNSLSKIALGIRDNLVCCWALHALKVQKPAIVTLNTECQPADTSPLPQALRTRLAQHVATLREYGFTLADNVSSAGSVALASATLITLSDVRQYPQGHTLSIHPNTLITPAAHDEIRDRGITITRSLTESLCI